MGNIFSADIRRRSPWLWVPSLYFAEGIPYMIVNTVSILIFKQLGMSNAMLAFFTSFLMFPWVIKPLWTPLLDMYWLKKRWIMLTQFTMGICFAVAAFVMPLTFATQLLLLIFMLLAFFSATHDAAADGFYMLGLNEEKQAFFIGIRNTFYRVAMITGQGLLVMIAGFLEQQTGNIPMSWSLVFFILAGLFIALSLWHHSVLPNPVSDERRMGGTVRTIWREFLLTFYSFFTKKGIIPALLFMLTYRLGESQLVKLASPFLLDSLEQGGLGLSTGQVGFVYGTVGVIALLLGGILGGIAISRQGLKRWMWPMAWAISLPNLVYLYMACLQPQNFWVINACVAVEQFGYGFGFTAYTMYLMLFSEGKYKTSHYAISTGFMALGMMLPGMFSGWIQEWLGYQLFFVWVMVCCIPLFLVLPLLKIK